MNRPDAIAAKDLPKLSRRQYLLIKAMEPIDGQPVHWAVAMEAVSSTAIEHPEWDMNEEKTWAEWEKS